MLLTLNEAANLSRTLSRLAWAKEIVIIDSFSSDSTLDIARGFPQVKIFQRKFDTFADQCNFGMLQVRSSWVLSLDADYVLSEELVAELQALCVDGPISGFYSYFQYWVCGRPLRASLYPPRLVLYRRDTAQYKNDGHGHKVCVNGVTRALRGVIFHDDRKPLARWLVSQDTYARLEAEKLNTTPASQLPIQDRLRSWILPAAPAAFFYTLLVKRTVLDGWPGWLYALQRLTAEAILSMRLIEKRIGRSVFGKPE